MLEPSILISPESLPSALLLSFGFEPHAARKRAKQLIRKWDNVFFILNLFEFVVLSHRKIAIKNKNIRDLLLNKC